VKEIKFSSSLVYLCVLIYSRDDVKNPFSTPLGRQHLLALGLNALYAAIGSPGEQASELASIETANWLIVDTFRANVMGFRSPYM
jgi:hypothetical protein